MPGRRALATAVLVEDRIVCQELRDRIEVACRTRRCKSIHQLRATFCARAEARPVLAHVLARTLDELTASGFTAAERLRDRVVVHVEHVVEQECGALER